LELNQPHAASTTRDRGHAAADLAFCAKNLGLAYVLKDCAILDDMQRTLFPEGIESLLTRGDADSTQNSIRPSTSALSLSSLVDDSTITGISLASDSKRGKTTPANAREGCLLFLRALCEIVGQPAEPYVVGAFLAAALDECASSSSAVREAAEDTAQALVGLAHPWAFPLVVAPLLLQSLQCSEWRVKAAALERLAQASSTAPAQVHKMIPTLIPAISPQVWDTKAQVGKGARAALLAVCDTNANPDIKPCIPAVVNAICKPAETNKAVEALMGTTFVVPVDASTLAILCPILARALKEKLAIHKRSACIVISNMSKLVDRPQAVAPFGSLLVPELRKVAQNVQFEEIRDEALKALANLTKALGDLYREDTIKVNQAQEMQDEQSIVETEQKRIQEAREVEAAREEELRKKEEQERQKFKDAMEAQRKLDKLAAEEAEKKRKEAEQQREKEKLSTKAAGGKCQACGLKKCKKSCMFYTGK
jgi:hypothetical protein